MNQSFSAFSVIRISGMSVSYYLNVKENSVTVMLHIVDEIYAFFISEVLFNNVRNTA